jgi:acetyltransferase
MSQHFLWQMFAPRTIAVFGASAKPESVGGRIYDNLKAAGFPGPVLAINPKYPQLKGDPCYPGLSAVQQPVDLVVIATPAPTVAAIMRACGEHGVRAVIVITAGFSERGAEGRVLEQELVAIARRYRMHMLGPNCLGLMRPASRMNATFSKNVAKPGQLALVSQSGALCTAILDWAEAKGIGFSALVSLGAAADVGFGAVLDYLAQDPETHSILLYVEGIRDARSFISGLRAAARLKPVIVIKAGRQHEGSKAATTHTGAIVGADAVFDAALHRAGVVRVLTIEQLFAAAQLLSTRCRIRGKRLAIITNGGGLGVMAVDRAIDLGIQLAALTPATIAALDQVLPPHWSHANPVDILGDAGSQRYLAALQACVADPEVDGVLVMLAPQAMTDIVGSAEVVATVAASTDKPVLACWMGGHQIAPAQDLFAARQVPHFDSPEASVEAFAYLARYHYNQQLLLQVPAPLALRSQADVTTARQIIAKVLADSRTMLDQLEAKALLRAFDIPVSPSVLCRSVQEALMAADSLGFPVALKIHSRNISHKSDVGGVRLNINNAETLFKAYDEMLARVKLKLPEAVVEGVTIEPMQNSRHGRELLIGVVSDPVFGPALSFGAGGVNVEVLQDRAIALPPLNTFLIENMISHTRVAKLLGEYRGSPAIDKAALMKVLRRVSEMVCEIPEIKALDINPLVADEYGVVALDARVEIAAVAANLHAYQHMAIHPYPVQLVTQAQLQDGTTVIIRPIRPEDAELEKNFIQLLSPEARHFRFMQELKELTRATLVRFTQLDYDRELALIALEQTDGSDATVENILGLASYVMNPDGSTCEFALVVADAWQGKGLGTRLMNELMHAARLRGFRELNAEVLADNANMLELMDNLGFSTEVHAEDVSLRVVRKAL